MQAANYSLVLHSLHLSLEDHPNKVQKWENVHFMLINSPDCSTCLFSGYGLLIMVGGVVSVDQSDP